VPHDVGRTSEVRIKFSQELRASGMPSLCARAVVIP
jgi:hypothetical protein